MKKTTLLLSALVALAFTACNKSEFEGYTTAENGLNYKFFNHDEAGHKAEVGDGVGFKYVIRIKSNDSVLVDSRMVSQDGSGVIRFMMPESSFKGSLEDAMMMMSKGDSASFIISADSFFLKTNRMQELPKFIKPGEKLEVTIKLAEIKTKKELEENQKEQELELQKLAATEKTTLDKYIADNKITTAPTASGLYYIEQKKGTGPKATVGQLVTVSYRGTTLDGVEFDSSYGRPEPFKFVLGQTPIIQGWDEALQLMSKGGKAKLIIPSAIGYGPQGRGQAIPPFATLLFDVELVNIEKAPEASVIEGGMPE